MPNLDADRGRKVIFEGEENRLWTRTEVAERFGVERGTVAKWIKAGLKVQPLLGRKRTRISSDALIEFLGGRIPMDKGENPPSIKVEIAVPPSHQARKWSDLSPEDQISGFWVVFCPLEDGPDITQVTFAGDGNPACDLDGIEFEDLLFAKRILFRQIL